MTGGSSVDAVLDRLHQAFFDANTETWGEGPIAERNMRAMMAEGEAPRRTPEQVAEMERRKAELAERRAQRDAAKRGDA